MKILIIIWLDAIDTNDIGRMKSAISVLEYGKLLMKNHKFKFIE